MVSTMSGHLHKADLAVEHSNWEVQVWRRLLSVMAWPSLCFPRPAQAWYLQGISDQGVIVVLNKQTPGLAQSCQSAAADVSLSGQIAG